jgi:Na+(H+)/acetate symporter ActP
VYSLLVATFLGTMGLPHILVRFYTNPDGPAARQTTVRVLGLLGIFYLFPVVYGLLGRALVPELYVTGATDTVVLRLPEAAWPGLGGEILGAIVAAGAFAAFMSTASGLLVSIAGTLSFDLWERVRRPGRGAHGLRRAHSGWAPWWGWWRPRSSPSAPARSTSACWWAGPSPSPRARSARFCCSASGGRG